MTLPTWLEEFEFHPADSYMSISKDVWRTFSPEEILKVRKTYYDVRRDRLHAGHSDR